MRAALTKHREALEALCGQGALGAKTAAVGLRHLAALRALLADAIARGDAAVAGCETCAALPRSAYVLSTMAEPASLPAPAYRFLPSELVSASRCRARVLCRSCETPYRYRRDYEYLVGGTEDEEYLDRLTPGVRLDAMEVALERAAGREATVDSEELALLRLALAEDLSAEAAAARATVRAAIAAAREGGAATDDALGRAAAPFLRAEAAVVAGCPVCRVLPTAVEPLPAPGLYVNPRSEFGALACGWCGTAYRVEFSADWKGQRLTRLALGHGLERLAAAAPDERSAALDVLDEALDHARLDGPCRAEGADEPLHFFVGNAREDGVRALLAGGADPDGRDGNDWTPLLRAAAGGQLALIDLLLAAGAGVDARNVVGETALYLAAESGHADAVARLLTAGADPGIASSGPNAASRRRGLRGVAPAGTTPLVIAEQNGHAAVVRLLTRS